MLTASYSDLIFLVVGLWFFIFVINNLFTIFILNRKQVEKEEIYDEDFGRGIAPDRNGKWRSLRNRLIDEAGCCAVCQKKTNLIVHHKIPFHVDPSLELDENNLVVLCENDILNCHLIFGHLGNWREYNEEIDKDIEIWNKKLNR